MVIFKRQTPPPGLKENCLLTRYPICFIHGLKSIFTAKDYWHGIPKYLAGHGYVVHELFGPWRGPNSKRLAYFANQLSEILKGEDKVHLIAHSLGTLNSLELLNMPEFERRIASCTFVSPPFGGSPFAELGLLFGKKLFQSTNETLTKSSARKIFEKFHKPEDVLIGSILSVPKDVPITPTLKTQHFILKKFLHIESDALVPIASQRIAESLGEIFMEFPGDHNQVIGSGPWPESKKTAHSVFLEHAIFLAEYDLKHGQ